MGWDENYIWWNNTQKHLNGENRQMMELPISNLNFQLKSSCSMPINHLSISTFNTESKQNVAPHVVPRYQTCKRQYHLICFYYLDHHFHNLMYILQFRSFAETATEYFYDFHSSKKWFIYLWNWIAMLSNWSL